MPKEPQHSQKGGPWGLPGARCVAGPTSPEAVPTHPPEGQPQAGACRQSFPLWSSPGAPGAPSEGTGHLARTQGQALSASCQLTQAWALATLISRPLPKLCFPRRWLAFFMTGTG